MNLPRPEYPRPQWVRSAWLNLNGEWQFEIDAGDSGQARGLTERELRDRITVPFCPESTLSGIAHTDFMNAVWYRRTVVIPANWAGQRVMLHFQAVDYDTTVWVDGLEVGRHRGGFTPFACDLGERAGQSITIVVRARDDNHQHQPRGKQSRQYASHGCFYTRTTGIWQTVWLEAVPHIALHRPRITPDVANTCFRLEQPITRNVPGLRLQAVVRDDEGVVVSAQCRADLDLAPRLDLVIPPERLRLWSPSAPFLYDLEIALLDAHGHIVDRVGSYAGLRCVAIDGRIVKLNGVPVFQRLVLDQGYYPDGIMTAPSDAALIADITLAQAAGFNGARLHQKVFEERFLYHADRLGYLVWGEFGDWGLGDHHTEPSYAQPAITVAGQWLEAVARDYSHPSIIGWCPLNETWQRRQEHITTLDDATHALFLATKAFDTSRPVLDTSGFSHREHATDIFDVHDYLTSQDFWAELAQFKTRYARLAEGHPHVDERANLPYHNQPFFVSEFGGIWWDPAAIPDDNVAWGYGTRPPSIAEFYLRFQALCDVLLDHPAMFGYCYTQLTDVYPEQNGLFTFDRTPKFDLARLHAIQSRPAAIEQGAEVNVTSRELAEE